MFTSHMYMNEWRIENDAGFTAWCRHNIVLNTVQVIWVCATAKRRIYKCFMMKLQRMTRISICHVMLCFMWTCDSLYRWRAGVRFICVVFGSVRGLSTCRTFLRWDGNITRDWKKEEKHFSLTPPPNTANKLELQWYNGMIFILQKVMKLLLKYFC